LKEYGIEWCMNTKESTQIFYGTKHDA